MKTLLISTINKMKSGEMVKANGFEYSQKTCNHYLNIVNSLSISGENPEEILRSSRLQIQSRGSSASTEKTYTDALVFLMGKIGVNCKKLAIKTANPLDYIPEPERVWKMIEEFKPSNYSERTAFSYILAEMITGARYSDIASWTVDNVVQVNGKEYLRYQANKTGKTIQIPLAPRLKELFLDHYLFAQEPYPTILRNMKKVYKKSGFTNDVKREVIIAGQKKIVIKKEWEIINSHKIRACSITGLLQSGMTEHEVKTFSGHSPHSKSFHRYVRFSQDHIDSKYSKFLR